MKGGLALLVMVVTSLRGEAQQRIDPSRLSAIFDAADRVAVVENDPETGHSRTLFQSVHRDDIVALEQVLRVLPAEGVCGCVGTLHLRLHRGIETLVSVEYIGPRVRASVWDGEAELVSHEALLAWFDDRGVDSPRRQVRDDAARAQRAARSEERWVAAMPQSLKPLWAQQRYRILADPGSPDLSGWRNALGLQFPDSRERAAALLVWFGSGDGPWSGYPAYEDIAEELLLDFNTNELVAAIEDNEMEENALEGGARLLASWDFRQMRKGDKVFLPESLKALLLRHSLKSADQDKRERAVSAFANGRAF